MDDKEGKLYGVETVADWHTLYTLQSDKFRDDQTEWVFRGENPESTESDPSNIPEGAFKSRLIEDFDRFRIEDDALRRRVEQRLIRHFRRKAHLHTTDKAENWLECLALIQHYEGPTRMLDWTYSFFAAVYFAINRAKANKDGRVHAVVWALDNEWLGDRNKKSEDDFIGKHDKDWIKKLETLRQDGRGQFENRVVHSFITQQLADSKTPYEWLPMVYTVNPYYLNERLSSQQGVLICPSQIDKPWGANLQSMLQESQNRDDTKLHLWRIEIECETVEVQKEFLKRLLEMNISQASLFPDLDGLAKSLRIWMIKRHIMRE